MRTKAERANDPAWKASYAGLLAEAAKVGQKISSKGIFEMSKGELHEERKALRAVSDSLAGRAKAILADGEARGTTLSREGSEKLDGIYAMMEVAGDLIRDVGDKIDLNGMAEEAFAGASHPGVAGDRVPVLTRNDSFARILAAQGEMPESSARVGLGECIRAMLFGSRDARPEVRNTLSEGTDSAGGFTVPTYLMGQIIDRLRARAVTIQAGALTIPLETQKTSIARLASDPLAAWRAENAAVGGTDPTFEKITFTAQSLACLIKVSREVLEDSLNLESAITGAIVKSMALELDRVAMFGSGTPPEPQGFFGLGTINSVSMGTNGAQLTNYDKLLDAMYELELDNNAAPSAFIMHPRTSRTLRGLKDTTNQPMLPPPALADVPQLVTTAVPITQTQGTSGAVCSSVLAGDFSQMLIGIRSGLRIQLLTERFADNLQVGFLITMRGDVQFAHPESFVKLIGVLP